MGVVLVVFYHTTSQTIMQNAHTLAVEGRSPSDYIVREGINFVFKSFLVGLAGYLLEVEGVSTGLIFGSYNYGDTLGPKLFDVPLILGFNWFFMVYCSTQIAMLLKWPLLPTAILSGAIMTVYDLVLEPNAIALNFWTWEGGTIPLQNYVAWFLFGTLFCLFYLYRSTPVKNPMAIFLFTIQWVFFLSLIAFR